MHSAYGLVVADSMHLLRAAALPVQNCRITLVLCGLCGLVAFAIVAAIVKALIQAFSMSGEVPTEMPTKMPVPTPMYLLAHAPTAARPRLPSSCCNTVQHAAAQYNTPQRHGAFRAEGAAEPWQLKSRPRADARPWHRPHTAEPQMSVT